MYLQFFIPDGDDGLRRRPISERQDTLGKWLQKSIIYINSFAEIKAFGFGKKFHVKQYSHANYATAINDCFNMNKRPWKLISY